jgi:hypothetical protein
MGHPSRVSPREERERRYEDKVAVQNKKRRLIRVGVSN